MIHESIPPEAVTMCWLFVSYAGNRVDVDDPLHQYALIVGVQTPNFNEGLGRMEALDVHVRNGNGDTPGWYSCTDYGSLQTLSSTWMCRSEWVPLDTDYLPTKSSQCVLHLDDGRTYVTSIETYN
jgi:hypothetical protein